MLQITTKEASQILGISKRTLFRWEKEERIISTREGILKIRVYNRSYIVTVKKLLDLDKQIKEHNVKHQEIVEQSRKHQLEQIYHGKSMGLYGQSEKEASLKAFKNEKAWDTEHTRLNTEFGQLLYSYRTHFPDAPFKELFLKEERSK